MKPPTTPIYYCRKYYDNIEIGKAYISTHSSNTYQASAIVIKPYGVNLHHHIGYLSSSSLEDSFGHLLPKDIWDIIMGRLAMLNMNILDILKDGSRSKRSPEFPDCFYYIGSDILTLGEAIYIGKQNEQPDSTPDYENIVILLSTFPYIKLSCHSEKHHTTFANKNSAKLISRYIYDEIKELIFTECHYLHENLTNRINSNVE